MAEGAVVVRVRRDPWKDWRPRPSRRCSARGWPVATTPRGIDVSLGRELVAVVVSGKAGEDLARRLTRRCTASSPGGAALARRRAQRAPLPRAREGMPVPTAENLHGAVAG